MRRFELPRKHQMVYVGSWFCRKPHDSVYTKITKQVLHNYGMEDSLRYICKYCGQELPFPEKQLKRSPRVWTPDYQVDCNNLNAPKMGFWEWLIGLVNVLSPDSPKPIMEDGIFIPPPEEE